MKNGLTKLIASFAIMTGLAGCVNTPIIDKYAICIVPKEISLGNKYSAESKKVKKDIGIAIGIAAGDIIVKEQENGIHQAKIPIDTESYFEKEPVLSEQICEMADVDPTDNFISEGEALGMLIFAFRHSQYYK